MITQRWLAESTQSYSTQKWIFLLDVHQCKLSSFKMIKFCSKVNYDKILNIIFEYF